MRALWVVLSLWACVMTRAKAQGQQVSSATCECTGPTCEALEETKDCNKVPRGDCPCCMVCQQESKCSLDGDCPESRFCLGGMCADPCELLQPCKNTLEGGYCKATNHRPTCVCKEGWIKNSDGTVCIPNEKNNTGCVNKGRLYSEDEVLYRDSCSEQCRCGANGQFSCNKPTCPPGLFLTGQHDHDELCIELRNRPGTDDCCVVVVCANSLSEPTSLVSPSKFPPIAADATFERANGIRSLAGATTTTKPVKPISDEEYKTNIKVLESVLNSKVTKKPIYEDDTTAKPEMDGLKTKSTTDDMMEKITESPVTELMEKNGKPAEDTTELNIEDQTELGLDLATTMAPKDMMTKPAVVVEHDDFGNEVHRMTIHTEVEVVTPSSNILEEESATEHIVHQSLDPSQQREPRKDEGDLNSTSDKNSNIKTNLEEKESIGKLSSTSLKTLVVTHNSTTLFLPSTKGGELFYKDGKSSTSDWVRQEVEAGQDSTVLRGLMPNTHYTIKWSGQAGNSAKVNIETKDGCSKLGETWAVGSDWTLGCQEKCSCHPGGKLECRSRCLFTPGSINDSLCTEKPTAEDPECCVVYDCRSPDDPEPVSSTPTLDSEPKLIVTTKSHNFITLAWENFSRSAEGVYFAEYRQSPKDGSSNMGTEDSWQKTETTQGNQMPSITIDNLLPSTMYQVRISMIDNEQPGNIFATETISVKTEVGCMYGSSSYGVGEFMVGCEERCMCYANATVTCTQPCELPYFRAGSFANDSYCREQRANPDDECCVLATCESSAGNKTEYEPCSNIVCGGNAECVSGVSPNEGDDVGYCRCKPGFIGDAKDLKTGCVKDSSAKELTCTFKNDTYKPGDVFDDSCDYKCSCSNKGELECQPRCEFPHENGAVTEAGCQYLPDPNDECCKLRVCNSTSEAATDAARAPLLPTDGCTFGNRTFAKDEKFSDGCEQNCTCMGYGDVSCFPRCPPVKVLPGAKCHTLPDPEDTCCSITVCADKPIDVMKANITGNLLNEEANMNMTEEELVHSHGNLTHSHIHTSGDNHTHEDEHENKHGDVTHSHSNTHDDENITHTNEHVHMHGDMTHSHPHTPGDNHTHVELEHSHGNMTHSHPHIPGDNHTHEEFEHTHGNMTHSHPHIIKDNHTHEEEFVLMHGTDENEHTHENMPHAHEELEHSLSNIAHSHTHPSDDDDTKDEHEHVHGNMSHSHPHIEGDNHTHVDNMMITHEHSHDNITHTHPHIIGDDHTHGANKTFEHDHDHQHDGDTHSHPHEHGVEHDHNTDMAHIHEHVTDTHHAPMHNNDTDVNVLESDLEKRYRVIIPLHELNIVEVAAINDTAVKIRVAVSDSVIEEVLSDTSQFITVHYSRDSLMWMEKMISVSDISVENLNEILIVVNNLEPATPYQFRVDFDGISSLTSKGGPMKSPEGPGRIDIDTSSVCNHKGEYYKIGEEFYEGCAQFCFCGQNLEVHCAAIECPETFGLDVIDPDCLEWDREPDFVPTPPRCCGTVTCKVSAACHYEGQTFRNFDLLPTEFSGCDKRCSCGYGNITCSDVCAPISDQPPANLHCLSDAPIKETMSGEYCCMEWKCPESSVAGPPPYVDFPRPPGGDFTGVPPPFPQPVPDFGVSEPLVQSIDSNTVDFTFSIPPQYKGLPGDIYIRYIKTEDLPNSADPKSWLKQEVGTEGFISQVTWQYVMENLDAGSQYSMQLVLQPIGIDPVTSPIFDVTTQPSVTTVSSTTALPFLEVDAALHASEVSSSDAKITWRKFSDEELHYIDGFQIKYMAEGKLMPKFSQYFHRDNHMIMLRDLEPGTNYTVDLVFLEQGSTQVYNTKNITFETLRVEDPYAFDITAEVGKIDAQTATVFYSGVPEPEEKYVNIYRAIYIFENDQIDDQSFKIPKVGDEKQIFLNNLKPDTEYQVWIEAYLANGRKKKSNVITMKTKADQLPKPERTEALDLSKTEAGSDDYYGALVAVAIIAAIACLGFLGLLFILVRRNNHGNATINSPRSDAAYDNPSYKVGDNTYDMEMNGLSGKNGNGAAHIDDP